MQFSWIRKALNQLKKLKHHRIFIKKFKNKLSHVVTVF